MNCLVQFPNSRSIKAQEARRRKAIKARKSDKQSDLFSGEQLLLSCPLGCGRKDLLSEQAVAGHLGHCKLRQRRDRRKGVQDCRAVVDRLLLKKKGRR